MDAISVSPRNEWTEVDIEEVEEEGVSGDAQKRAKIWLLGDLPRRNHPMRTVHLYSNEERLREALDQPTQPVRTILQAAASTS